MESKSKILIIGGTGYIGKHIVKASIELNHPTYILVRDLNPSDLTKSQLLKSFEESGVVILQGDIHNHESLITAIKSVDVVISAVGYYQIEDQIKIIDAIKESGNIKRFFPSDFGNDVDHANIEEPAKKVFDMEKKIRRIVEEQKIPYTFVSCNLFASYFLPTISQYRADSMPNDKIKILGDGNTPGIYLDEDDIGIYTIKAVDDWRTLNKVLHIRPHENILSQNDLVLLWEKKVGKKFERVYLSEEEVLKQLKESPSADLAIFHSVFINGDQMNFEIDPLIGVEATELYPDVKYTTVDQYLNRYL